MSDSILRERSKQFAKDVVFLCREAKKNGTEAVLANQLLRSGTSIGANVYEAQYAQGTKDFISKLEIALKEANESAFWIELIYETGGIPKEDFSRFYSSCVELRRMLVASIRTVKNNHGPSEQ